LELGFQPQERPAVRGLQWPGYTENHGVQDEQIRGPARVSRGDEIEAIPVVSLEPVDVNSGLVVLEEPIEAIPELATGVGERACVRLKEAEPAARLEDSIDLVDGLRHVWVHVVQAAGDEDRIE
jgi:hypothetical protein